MESRPYQNILIHNTTAQILSGNSTVLQSVTGSGKSYMAQQIIDTLGPGNCLWLTHRRNLASQIAKYYAYSDLAYDANKNWHEGEPPDKDRLAIMTTQTFQRRAQNLDVTGLFIIIDEVHTHFTDTTFDLIADNTKLGLTATPWYLDKDRALDKHFDILVTGPDPIYLVDHGYLAPLEYMIRYHDARALDASVLTSSDGVNEAKMQEKMERGVITEQLYEYWREHDRDQKTLIFAASQIHARELLKYFTDAEYICDSTPQKERERILAWFENTRQSVLINVGIFREGFDCPDLDLVYITRPTKSLSLFLQMIGRCSRTAPGKEKARVVDFTDNASRFGHPYLTPRTWSLKKRRTEPEVEGFMDFGWCQSCIAEEPEFADRSDIKGCSCAPKIFAKCCPNCHWVQGSRCAVCSQCEYMFGRDCPECGVWCDWEHISKDPVTEICHACQERHQQELNMRVLAYERQEHLKELERRREAEAERWREEADERERQREQAQIVISGVEWDLAKSGNYWCVYKNIRYTVSANGYAWFTIYSGQNARQQAMENAVKEVARVNGTRDYKAIISMMIHNDKLEEQRKKEEAERKKEMELQRFRAREKEIKEMRLAEDHQKQIEALQIEMEDAEEPPKDIQGNKMNRAKKTKNTKNKAAKRRAKRKSKK